MLKRRRLSFTSKFPVYFPLFLVQSWRCHPRVTSFFLATKTKTTTAILHGRRFCGCVTTTSMVAALYLPDMADCGWVLIVLIPYGGVTA